MPPPQRLGEYKLELLRLNSWRFVTLKAWLPQRFVSFVGFSWPSGVFFLSSGWVGFPLPCFPLPPPLLALLSSGWVGSPCRVFPVFSPWFSGGLGVVFCVFVFLLLLPSLASCIFLLLQLRQYGLPTRKPPGPPRPFPWCVGPDPSPAGSRRSDAPRLRAGG